IDPRLSRTAAHATEYVRVRPGTHIATIYGMLWHIFKNGWEDKEFIAQRVYGMDDVRKEVEKWAPDEVERVTGLPEAQVKRVAEVDYDWMLSRFDSKQAMETPGIPSTRWFDAAMLPKDQVAQKDNLRAMMVFGHGGNTVTRMPEAAKGIEKLDLLVVGDPHP